MVLPKDQQCHGLPSSFGHDVNSRIEFFSTLTSAESKKINPFANRPNQTSPSPET